MQQSSLTWPSILAVIEHHRIFISNLIMSNILAKAENNRLINMFQAFAMNILSLF